MCSASSVQATCPGLHLSNGRWRHPEGRARLPLLTLRAVHYHTARLVLCLYPVQSSLRRVIGKSDGEVRGRLAQHA